MDALEFALVIGVITAVVALGILLNTAWLGKIGLGETLRGLWDTYFSSSEHLPQGGDENRRIDPKDHHE